MSSNNEFLTAAENQATPWLPPPITSQLYSSAYGDAAAGTPATTTPQGNAAIAQPGAAAPSMTADQAALTFANLSQSDMSAFYQALPAADQQALSTALQSPNITEQQLAQVFSQLPQADVQAAFSKVPGSDLQAAMTAASSAQTSTPTDTTAGANPAQTTAPTDATGSTAGTTGTPDAATVFANLPQADMQTFYNALPSTDQSQLSAVLSAQNPTLQQLQQVFSQLPASDVSAAFAAVPASDLQTATTAAAAAAQPTDGTPANGQTQNTSGSIFGSNGDATAGTPAAATSTQPSDVTKALGNLTPDQAATLLGALPQGDSTKFMNALPTADQQTLSSALSGQQNITEPMVAKAIGGLPQGDVVAAFSSLPTSDLQAGLQALTTAASTPGDSTAGKTPTPTDKTPNTAAPAAADSGSGGGTDWVKYGAYSALGLAAGAVAYKKFNLGDRFKAMKAKLPGGGEAAAESPVAPEAAEVPKNTVQEFDTAKPFTEGPFEGGSLTKLTETPGGVLSGENPEGIFGSGTATELHVFPQPVAITNGPFAGGRIKQYSEIGDSEMIGENPEGIFNGLQGTAGTTITKYSVRPGGRISENAAGLEGPGTRTVAADFDTPFKVEAGPFEGMNLTHLSAVPTEDGHMVTVMNRAGLLGEGTDTGKVAALSTDELQTLLKGTTATSDVIAKAATEGGGVAAAAGEDLTAKVVGTLVDGAEVASKA